MSNKIGVTDVDLSKAFESLNYELRITKLKCLRPEQNAFESQMAASTVK